jgi:starvation-inducible DNA-binding protein
MPATAQSTHLFSTKIDLPEKSRQALVKLLNQQLADTTDLYTQTKQAHWNVKGMNFYQLHLLFDDLAKEVFEFQDLIAERATALGGYATGTVKMAAASSTLPDYPREAVDGREHLEALIARYSTYAAATRKAIDAADELHDRDTSDLFTQVSREIDKSLWFLESHLQK